MLSCITFLENRIKYAIRYLTEHKNLDKLHVTFRIKYGTLK